MFNLGRLYSKITQYSIQDKTRSNLVILEDRNYLIWIKHWALPERICNPPVEDNIEKFQGGITEFDKKKKCKRNIYRNFSGHS